MNGTQPAVACRPFLVRHLPYFGVFVFSFFYIWLRIEPGLIFQRQEPAFLFECAFFFPFVSWSGGLLEYAASFFTSLFFIPALGAGVITLALLGVTLFTRAWLHAIRAPGIPGFLEFLPAAVLLMLHMQYAHPFADTLGLLTALGCSALLRALSRRRPAPEIMLFIVLMPLLRHALAGPAFFFALLSILQVLSEPSRPRRIRFLQAAFFLAAAGILFLIPAAGVSGGLIRETMLKNLISLQHDRPAWAPVLLYGFYPASWLASLFMRRPVRVGREKRMSLCMYAGVAAVYGLAVLFAFRDPAKSSLKIALFSHEKRWDDLLEIAREEKTNRFFDAVQVNRALHHQGKLLESMFEWPQTWGTAGLLIPQEYGYVLPLAISDLFFEMGHVTESQHWAYEAQAVNENSPRNLERLFMTHLLKGNPRIAARYLFHLKHSPLYGSRTSVFEALLREPSLILKDPDLAQIYNRMPASDFIVRNAYPEDDLVNLLKSNPANRMAFEYLMAWRLLSRQVEEIALESNRLALFRYTHIPRHIEEALLIHMVSKSLESLTITGYAIRKQTIDRFKEFLDAARKIQGDRNMKAHALYAQFRDTYWFYYYYHIERGRGDIELQPLSMPGMKK
jgi:hypothetical protein